MAQSLLVLRLRELARNLWWVWQPEVIDLFRSLDPELWTETRHNPIVFLKQIDPEALQKQAEKMALDSRVDYAFRRLKEYLENRKSWGAIYAASLRSRPVAYFSAEFGLHESLPIYSGGLGVLAGDHLKSASDLGIPLVAVGLLYSEGYFRQSLDADGWQKESYPYNNPDLLPIEPALDPDGKPIMVSIPSRTSTLHAKVWTVDVGRTKLFLLDSRVPENTEWDQTLTARLYGGDARVRIRQELLLGVGGVQALKAAGIRPAVIHLNEGHSAFALLAEIRNEMLEQGQSFWDAAKEVSARAVFTTHTPVAAGHDRFWAELLEENLGLLREQVGMSYDDFMGLGRVHPHDHGEPFCMTVLALKLTRRANGVSAIHGEVSRQMWHPLYHNRRLEEVPIGHITNGVHAGTWIAPQMQRMYDLHLPTDWRARIRHPEVWTSVDTISDSEFWETHQILKASMISYVRHRLVQQAKARGESGPGLEKLSKRLDIDTLTIGFARRFATYKRAGLSEAENLIDMVQATGKRIQLVFAGKAHPEDKFGKELIQSIVKKTGQAAFEDWVVFVEDYDMSVARHLVQGVDVWLNNPRRPQEASGTSGEKALLNGVLNFSVLDGWWAEAYNGINGFAIGHGQTHVDPHIQDKRDHENLIHTLMNEVIPLYYDRDSDGLPKHWIARQKAALRSLGWRFNADRMVMDYTENCYLPAAMGISCQIPF
jgi:glycogen phosphorylase